MAAYMKVLPLFMMVFPGMISRVLFPGEKRVGKGGHVSVSLRPRNARNILFTTLRECD